MPHVTLTKEQPIHPAHSDDHQYNIDKVEFIPRGSTIIDIKNITQNGLGCLLIFNFLIRNTATIASHQIKVVYSDSKITVKIPDKSTSFYINLEKKVGNTTKISFDLEFRDISYDDIIRNVVEQWKHDESFIPPRMNSSVITEFPNKELVIDLMSQFKITCNGNSQIYDCGFKKFATTCLHGTASQEQFQGDLRRLKETINSYNNEVTEAINKKMDECAEKYGDQASFF